MQQNTWAFPGQTLIFYDIRLPQASQNLKITLRSNVSSPNHPLTLTIWKSPTTYLNLPTWINCLLESNYLQTNIWFYYRSESENNSTQQDSDARFNHDIWLVPQPSHQIGLVQVCFFVSCLCAGEGLKLISISTPGQGRTLMSGCIKSRVSSRNRDYCVISEICIMTNRIILL